MKNQSESYHYYMALCEYKNGNHLASLEHLKSDELIEKYVSRYNVILSYYIQITML